MTSGNVQVISRRQLWAGRILRTVVTCALVGSATAKVVHAPKMVADLMHAGIPQGAIVPIAVLELVCLALYLARRTAILGTVLLTGFFGGAVVTHIIGGGSFIPPLVAGVWAWGGTYLRFPKLRSFLPLMDSAGSGSPSVRVMDQRTSIYSRLSPGA